MSLAKRGLSLLVSFALAGSMLLAYVPLGYATEAADEASQQAADGTGQNADDTSLEGAETGTPQGAAGNEDDNDGSGNPAAPETAGAATSEEDGISTLGLDDGISTYADDPIHTVKNSETGDVFVGGNYIELGISNCGSFGTTAGVPAESASLFHPKMGTGSNSSTRLGMVSKTDGIWNNGTNDYFMPGTIDESFTIGYKTASGAAQIASGCDANAKIGTGIQSGASTTASTTASSVTVVTTGTTTTGIAYKQTVSFGKDDKYFTTTIELTNTTSDAITDTRYMRAFDPDQCALVTGGTNQTNNVVGHKDLDKYGTSVVAYGKNDTVTAPFIFFSADYRATAGYTTSGLSFTDVYNTGNTMVTAKNATLFKDNDIFIYFDLGRLRPGGTTEFSYISSLDTNLDSAIENIKKTLTILVDPAAGTLKGFTAGETYTVNDGTSNWTVAVAPDGTYTVTDASGKLVAKGTDAPNAGVEIIEPWVGKTLTVTTEGKTPAEVDVTLWDGASGEFDRADTPSSDLADGAATGDVASITVSPAVVGQEYAVFDEGGALVAGWTKATSATLTFSDLPKGSYTVKTRTPGGDGILPSEPTTGIEVDVPYATELEKTQAEALDKLEKAYKAYKQSDYFADDWAALNKVYTDAKAAIAAGTDATAINSLTDKAITDMAGIAKKDAAFVRDYVSDDTGKVFTAVDEDSFETILGGEATWNTLTGTEKAAVNSKLAAAGSKPYEELLAAAKELDKAADAFIESGMTDKGGNIVTEANDDTFDGIIAAEDAYNKLSETEKAVVDKKLTDAGGKPFSELLADAKDLADEKAAEFIKDKLSGTDGKPITEVTDDTYETIISAGLSYDSLTPSEKDAINKQLSDAGATKPFEELLTDAEARKFIKENLTDADGKTITEATGANIGIIISAEDAYNALSQDQKDAVNEQLVAAGGKTYEELLKDAKALDESSDGFIKSYLTGPDGKIYTAATDGNYAQILSGKEAWGKLSQTEKDAINAKLVAAGGKTYEELLARAQELKDAADAAAKAAADKANRDKLAKTSDSAGYLLVAAAGTAAVALCALGAFGIARRRRVQEDAALHGRHTRR